MVDLAFCFVTEFIPGINAPPPTATDEHSVDVGQDGDDALIQRDDSLTLPSDERREASDESDEDVDAVQDVEEEPSPEGEDGVTGIN